MSNDVDDLIGDAAEAKKPAKKAAAKKAEAKPAAKKAAAKPAAKTEAKGKAPAKKAEAKAPAKKAPAKKAAKKEATDPSESSSAVVQALLKVKKAISYADFAEKNDFNIRSVRRTARELRDGGHIELEKDGQTVMIKPAV